MTKFHYEVLVHLNERGSINARTEEEAAATLRTHFERLHPDAALVDVTYVDEEPLT